MFSGSSTLNAGVLRVPKAIFFALAFIFGSRADDFNASGGLSYTNSRLPEVPWSIHVVRVDRANKDLELHSMHSGHRAIGLSRLTEQIALWNRTNGIPVAGVNGDFYQRDRAFAGDPRGLQILEGELISGPTGGASFWIDALEEPNTGTISSAFEITWPDGSKTPFELNGERRGALQLYTSAVGSSTHSSGGREVILESASAQWLPLRIGHTYSAKVREVRGRGDSPISADTLVLSIPASMTALNVQKEMVLKISTATIPLLRGIRSAISGGPVLVHEGKQARIRRADSESFQVTSMFERHPRTCIGWNEQYFFLVEVDGRQRGLSMGMTLDELSKYLLKLGCTEGMNLDGGGSATLWYNGRIRNSPCEGREREVANSLLVTRKASAAHKMTSSR
jgi:hypothetical protein